MSVKVIPGKAKNGSHTLKIEFPDGNQKALHSIYNPVQEARHLVKNFSAGNKMLIIVLGCGLGYHIAELMNKYPDAKYVIVENIPEVIELAKDCGQVQDIEQKSKVIVSNTPEEAIVKITRHQLELGMPAIKLFPLPAAVSVFPDFYKPIIDKLNVSGKGRLKSKLKYTKFKNKKLRITFLDFGYFLSKEITRGIRREGHKAFIVEGSKNDSPGSIIRKLSENILNYRPDFVLTINHFGLDEEGILTSFLESIEMPVASWFVDSPDLIVKEFHGNVSPYVAIFVWDKTYEKEIRSVGFEHVDYLPLATDEKIFKPIRLKHKDLLKYRARVGFVGNSMVFPTMEKMQKVPEELKSLVEHLAGIISSERISYASALKRLPQEKQDKIANLPRKKRIAVEGATLWKATQEYRLACLRTIDNFKPVIHGDNGWRSLMNGNCVLRRPLHYYNELPLFYNSCEINLNATSLQMVEAVNQRVFDVPACRAFLLTDHQQSIESLFEVGREIITYREKEEIPELVKFYLRHPSMRDEVSKRGRRRVLQEHTYKKRIENIVSLMRRRYA